MEQIIKEAEEEMIEYDMDETEKDLTIAKKLKELNDKFNLDPKILEEYEKYSYYIDIDKYNM